MLAGFIVNVIRGFPPFQPLAMLGGLLFGVGNMLAVPTIKTIGLSLGTLIWGIAMQITGWSIATFGLFGLHAQVTHIPILNYVGAALAVPAAIVFSFIKPNKESTDAEKAKLLDGGAVLATSLDSINSDFTISKVPEETEVDWTGRLTSIQKRVIGVVFSLISDIYPSSAYHGRLFVEMFSKWPRLCFLPFRWYLAYLNLFFFVYAAIKKNHPNIYPNVIIPGFIGGLMWATATIGWFVANSTLGMVVTFPIVAVMPGVIASLWGILYYKEISGLRNYLVLTGAVLLTIVSTVLVALSQALYPRLL